VARLRSSIAAVALAAPIVLLAQAHARADFVNKTVRIVLKDASKKPIVGKVVYEDEEAYTVKLSYGQTTVQKGDVDKIEDIGPLVSEYEKQFKEAKTGDDYYKLGQWVLEKGLEKKLYYDCLREAVKKDPNHEAAHKDLGDEKVSDGRGGIKWVNKKTKKEVEKTEGSINKARNELGDRNWDDLKVIVRAPEKNTQYEILSNCPKDVADQYAKFMVDLRGSLTDLIQKTVGQPIQWHLPQCTVCNGTGKDGTKTCAHCGGGAKEPSKIYILNSQKLFMELTGKPEGVGGFYVPFNYPPADCERPIVCFHGTFGLSGNTYSVLGHEGTHQMEHLMWKGDFGTRPPWMIEGLAVYFGDGLNLTALDKGKFELEIPRDRLSGLKRFIKTGHNARVKDFTLCQYIAYQQNPILYNHAWSLIYYMLHSGQELEFKGKKYKLKDAFAKFFMKNTEEGYPILASFLGAENEADMDEVLSKLETGWKDWIVKLPIKSVYTTKDVGKDHKFLADELCFELSTSKVKKKGAPEWAPVPDEDLGWGEAVRLSCEGGSARISVTVEQNSKVLDIVQNENAVVEQTTRGFRNRLAEFNVIKRTQVTQNFQPGVELEVKGKDLEHPFLPKPRPEPQHLRVLVMATPKRIYNVVASIDDSKYDALKDAVDEVLKTFKLTGG
jgi:hypothetical protein